MKNNFITKIIGATLAFAMMIGGAVGINAGKQAKEVNAEESTVSWAATEGGLGSEIGSGTIKTGTYNWSYTRTLISGSSYTGWSSSCIQLGKNGGVENITFTTSEIPGTIKSVSVECASYKGAHNVSIVVGSSTYLASTATSSWTTVSAKSGTGTSSGAITISFTDGSRALYIKSLSVTYDTAALPESYYTVSFNTNGADPISAKQVTDDNNTPVERPTDPQKRGYAFVGWYDETLTNEYDFDAPVTGDMTLYAKWNKVSETASFSTALANGDYRISGEVTAITGASEFFVQKGNSAMKIGGTSEITNSLVAGNGVDLFGTYVSSSSILNNLAYCDPTSDTDETISQTAINDLNDVTDANLYKYFEISAVQLNSGFASNKQATIKDSSIIVYYNAIARVSTNNGAFVYGDYHQNDYVYVKGVINKTGNVLGLYITYIEKMVSHVITFNPNYEGGVSTTQTVLDSSNIQQPANPSRESDELYNYSFAGWYMESECENEYNFESLVTSSFTLYAKWTRSDRAAKEVIENTLDTSASLSYSDYTQTGFGVKDTLNNANTIKSTGTSYTDWTANGFASGAAYAGQSAGGNTSIQLRTTKPAGVVTTVSGGNATKVVVTWESHTSNGRTLNVYGKNTAYTEPADLYDDDKQGTLIGTIVYGTSTVLEINDDYAFLGFKAVGGAMYLTSIDIQWGEELDYDYTDLKIRFAGKVGESLWSRLDAESTITGYGMLLSTTDAIDDDNIADYYELADNYTESPNIKNSVVKFPSTKATPNLSGGNYGWSLHKNIPETDYKTTFIAVAYIVTQNDGVLFLDEIRTSAKDLANSLIQDGTYEEDEFGGSLKFLADQ